MLIPVDRILAAERIRTVSDAKVAALQSSIAEVGLLNPITVGRTSGVRDGRAVDVYPLIGGLHRLEAAKALGWSEIEATVTDLSGPSAIIAECDENLCGTNLTAAERALFTRRRKGAYEALHPETRHGGGRGASRQLGDLTDRFTADTATKTGRSERDIQRDAERGEKIPECVLEEVAGTALDKGVVLDRLAKAPEPVVELAAIKRERETAEAHKRNKEADRAIALVEAREFSEWLVARIDINELPVLVSWLASTKPKDVILALKRAAA